jgi:hypothetical protein
MPTTRPRHFVTETDDLAEALDAAARRWPGLSRSRLLVRLAMEGNRAARRKDEAERAKWVELVHRHSGAVTGAFEEDCLIKLHDEWPE